MSTDTTSELAEESKTAVAAQMRGTRAGLLLLFGIGAQNVCNGAFHLLSARLLGPARYGEVVSLVAAQGYVTLPFGGIQYTVARFAAEGAARGDVDAVAGFVRRAVTATAAFALFVTLAMVAATPLLQHALGIDEALPVVLMGLFMFPALLATTLSGVAQGLQRFGRISLSLSAGALSRVVLILMLIPLGLGVSDTMGATFIAGFVALIPIGPLAWHWTRRATNRAAGVSNRVALGYAAPVVGGTLAITSLTTADLIVAKLSLSAHDAGIYGSASFIGRLLLYLPMTIATVLLPKVTSRAAADQDTSEILHASLAVTATFSLLGTAFLVAVPRLVIETTFGSKYNGAIPLIGLFGLAMTLYALLNVQLAYHLGHGRKGVAWLLLGGGLAQLGLYAFVHGSTYQLVGANLATAAALLFVHEVAFESTIPQAARWAARSLRSRLRRASSADRGRYSPPS